MKLLMVSGTYNEKGNIERMIDSLFALNFGNIGQDVELHYLIVDDASPDGTAKAIQAKQTQYPERLHLIQREGKLGLGSAYLRAFEWALQRDYDALCQIDADFSHDPKEVPKMLAKLKVSGESTATADFVIGSRYVKGGEAAEDWRKSRKLLSRLGSIYAQIVMELSFKDITGGFNLWCMEVVCSILRVDSILSDGFFFQLEFKYKASRLGYTGQEHPIHFAERTVGLSKMNRKIMFEALFLAHKVSDYHLLKQFLRFAMTGGLGTVTNLAIFYYLVDLRQMSPTLVSILAFVVAASQNFAINSLWTFQQRETKGLSARYLRFVSSSLLGLAINIGVLNLVLLTLHPQLKTLGQLLGILAGLFANFIMSKRFVFKSRQDML